MRLAVIGLGRMGRFYARTLATLGTSVELVAVADPDAAARAALQADFDIPNVFADPLAAFDLSDTDAVVIATPTSSHAALVIAAAQSGKAIFCEKPLALSIEQTNAVLAAVDEARVALQVGFMRRFDPAFRQLHEAIQAGRIGRPVTFKAVNRDPLCPPPNFANPIHSGGLIVDMGIHDFDLGRWLMASEVERVSAEGALLACPDLEAVGDIDNAIVNLRFANGSLGHVEVSRNARYGFDIRTEVLGTDGAVVAGDFPTTGTDLGAARLLSPAPPSAIDDPTPHFVRRFAAAYRAQIEDFVDCIQHDREPSVGGADALAAFEIAYAATLSWRQQRPVSLSELRVARV